MGGWRSPSHAGGGSGSGLVKRPTNTEAPCFDPAGLQSIFKPSRSIKLPDAPRCFPEQLLPVMDSPHPEPEPVDLRLLPVGSSLGTSCQIENLICSHCLV